MKIKNLLVVAFAAVLGLASCSEENTPTDLAPKSVKLNLANVVASRSTGGEQIATGTPITLNNYQVFFSDGTNLYKGRDAQNAAEVTHYFTGTVPTEGSYHFLPNAVNSVIVIGNYGSEITATTEAQLDIELSIATQQNADNLTLYAKEALVSKSPVHDDNNPLYEADLTLKPRIARLFIKDFTCQFSDNPKFSKLSMMRIALNNYAKNAKLASGIVPDAATTPGNWIHNIVVGVGTVWNWFTLLSELPTTDWRSFSFDEIEDVEMTPEIPSVETDIYYHFFPTTTIPQLVLQGQTDGFPVYLPTLRFKDLTGKVITSFEPGYIYEMSFTFSDDAFSTPDKCIDITVNPVKWVVQTIIPEF